MSNPNLPQQPENGHIPQAAQPQPQPQPQPQSYPTTPYPTTQYPGAAQQPAYHAQQQRPAVPASTATTLDKTNTFAFLAIIFAFVAPLAGIIFGHLGLNQIKRSGDAGRGIALTGLIISYAYFALIIIFIIAYVGLIFAMIAGIGAAVDGIGSSMDGYSY